MAPPTKLTQAVHQRLVDAAKVGLPYRRAAQAAGVGETTFEDWRARGRAERQRIADAEAALEALPARAGKARRAAAEKACEPLDSERVYLELIVALEPAEAEGELYLAALVNQAAKDDWRAGIAILERRYPERWARRQTIEHTGSETQPVRAIVDVDATPEVAQAAHDFLRVARASAAARPVDTE